MGLDMLRARYMYENARKDFRTCIQLVVLNLLGFAGILVVYFVNDADELGVALWSLMYLILAAVCAILAMKSHKAVKYWEKRYEQPKEIIKEEYLA